MFSNVLIFDVNSIVKTYINNITQTELYNSYIDDVFVNFHYFGLIGLRRALVTMLITNFSR